ncbi:cytochrome C oxidase assembly protein [Porphyromonas gingivicanis]|uniref:Cytochrome C oxidase assembly protein n=1 Tax=Porphyromonas gingivicanis TaxID=266762 RepID=A0A0A2G581_9PORP|nr:cytochrome d ubiquinol oxidase subunit II [Porphyromonas gingivicanis]KGN97530.1 cytochrome C oxidase assembly protein [Porphyromonas gingivicanis]
MDYSMLQHYWWLLVSLLGALLVFLLFVQGGQTFIFPWQKDITLQKMIINSTGRKWEFTLTTLVTFGGAFFASFPLFYSTSFGGAYWVWMLILFCFVIQAISYEYQSKRGNVWGKKTFQTFLFINGVLAPILLGTAVSTFFTGANFIVSKRAIFDFVDTPGVISAWQPFNGIQLHGLEAVLNPWNLVLGLAVLFLARTTSLLYFINNIDDKEADRRAHKSLLPNALIFVVLFVAYVIFLLTKEGWAVDPNTGIVSIEAYKYLHNFLAMPIVLILFLVGVLSVLAGIGITILKPSFRKGIWIEGVGVVLTVLALLLVAGWNNTAYYPSMADMQSSLTIVNSSSSFYTLRAMAYVSILIPFVLAYIFYAWRAIDIRKITRKEITTDDHTY